MELKEKQPADQLDYDFDFSEWITDTDTILSASVVSSDASLVVVSTVVSSPFVKVWLNGGYSGKTYKITATITTSLGRIKQSEFKLRVREQ